MRPWPGSWRWIALVLLAWGTLLFYIGGHLVKEGDREPRSSRELAKILTKLERLKQQNEDLRRMAQSLRIPEGQSDGSVSSGRLRSLEEQLSRAKQQIHGFQRLSGEVGPGRDQEELRRKVENGVRELWYFIRSEIQKMSHVTPAGRQTHGDVLLQDLGHQQRSIMMDLYELSQADGAGDWREKEAKHLSSLVQNRISYLQNPQDCSKARKLLCNINKGCGYGCQLHHVVYCFMIAYGTQRVLILESHNWRYAPNGWETVFQPVSDTCTDRSGVTTGHWSETEETFEALTHSVPAGEAHDRDVQVVELPIVDSLHPRPPYLPLALPEDLAARLQRLHGDPSVWCKGRALLNLMSVINIVKSIQSHLVHIIHKRNSFQHKPKQLECVFEIHTSHIKYYCQSSSVCVTAFTSGGQIRSEQKQRFTRSRSTWFTSRSTFSTCLRGFTVDKKRVYLATDDPSLLQEAQSKYADYEFISDNTISWSASLHNRYTENSLRGVILDIHFLSQTDFLVCTFSSQVCRVAYEIMQTLHPDASTFFRSLDDIYYFGGQNAHNQIAVFPHQPRTAEDIPLEPGDVAVRMNPAISRMRVNIVFRES
ncbi:Alpha-(1,6)-fucosyltransferase [Triplophysa tibetana]|uniref:Alpha-(1,6)-fucosyltransferase n=1 Tax=Triplophysa tibetana TaxID=1572043 RepID=A0A5A9NH57_9TELE|nr:Alpha-(1,6)-fucosyltransferase [Triplophysa tibetana]